ncbi:hypothetical protein [Streptomyces sp. V1I1]|uniref:hypothetical protein n=1 Tax=Streptomyces sp. V1I1 TaxID=3042272 RepID=UPI00278A859C|nr:hypothetical protein [Streptomyces sp. V1I1]MDQ0945280.1 hypothetical protein [Streptomyces sp. V1I1]
MTYGLLLGPAEGLVPRGVRRAAGEQRPPYVRGAWMTPMAMRKVTTISTRAPVSASNSGDSLNFIRTTRPTAISKAPARNGSRQAQSLFGQRLVDDQLGSE